MIESDNLTQDSLHTRPHSLYILACVILIVNSNRQVRKDYLFIVAVLSTLIFSSMTVVNGFTNMVNGQTNVTQANSTNVTGLVNTQDIPLQKVHVGDIEMAAELWAHL